MVCGFQGLGAVQPLQGYKQTPCSALAPGLGALGSCPLCGQISARS